MFDPYSTALLDDPYPVYAALREDDPVCHLPEYEMWVLSRYDDVLGASRDPARFSSAEGVDIDGTGRELWAAGNILDTDPPLHDALRKVVHRHFTPGAVADLRDSIQARVDRLLDDRRSDESVDLVEHFSWPLAIGTAFDLLAVPESERAAIDATYRQALVRTPGEAAIPASALDAARELRARMMALLRARRGSKDLLSCVVREVEPRHALGLALILLGAAIETVSSLVASCLAVLEAQPANLTAAIEEVLRFEPPVQFNARTTTEAVEVRGVRIPAGARVLLLYAAANRDPRRWADPDVLDPNRPTQRHLGFGDGIHFCLGANLARLEAQIAVTSWLAAMEGYEQVGDPRRLTKQNLRGFVSLPVRVTWRPPPRNARP